MVIGGPNYSLFKNYKFEYSLSDGTDKLIDPNNQPVMYAMQSNSPEDWAFQSKNFLFGRLNNLKGATALKSYSALLNLGF